MSKTQYGLYVFVYLCVFLLTGNINAKERLKLNHSDQFEVIYDVDHYVTYVVGNVHFITETGNIYCDSARWIRGNDVQLNGHVIVKEEKYHLTADSVFYNMKKEEYLALGDNVELWSYEDSLLAAGNHAFFDKYANSFYMENRPVMYLNYPDTNTMYEVIGDRIDYDAKTKDAQAYGNVIITSKEFSSYSNCAKMNSTANILDLFDKPTVTHQESTIKGELISIYLEEKFLDYIDVYDSAQGNFKEPVDSLSGYYDESILKGKRIILDFQYGELDNILCYGQAYSWYYPTSKGSSTIQENEVSGDTIRFIIDQQELRRIEVVGGAIGQYLSGKDETIDSAVVNIIDTINYQSDFINYNIMDSLITLQKKAHVKSGAVVLDAHIIEFDTKNNIIEAFSADVEADTVVNPYFLSNEIQPNVIPVLLRDGEDEILGDYLLYSIDTEKGRIIQSKTDYTEGLYYGKKLYREQKEIYYVDEGRYTTCNAAEPHFHFKSGNMKMIEGKKLIARPIIFYVERVPVFALPYYIFPLEKGRHSGFLTFSFGQFEKGDRYVKDVGYYWAASDYFDVKTAFDYYDDDQRINFYNRVNFNKRYVLNGYFDANYTRVTSYNNLVGKEIVDPIWTVSGAYNHDISPSFKLTSYGKFYSNPNFTTANSNNLEERQNREIVSKMTFSKRFSNSVTLSGNASHAVNIDTETRTDNLPNMALSLPTLYLFGNGSKNAEGKTVRHFYHDIKLRYNPSLTNYSYRTLKTASIDTLQMFDTLGNVTSVTYDTTKVRTRKKYTKIQHSPSLTLPQIKLSHFLTITPSASYNETWYKVHETDQSIAAGIDASTSYRTYTYGTNLSATTKLYGTVYPRILGFNGFRHVITPTVSFSYRPELADHPEIRAFTGGGSASSKSRSINVSIVQDFLAKIGSGVQERSMELLSLRSNFSYDLEKEVNQFSRLSTSFSSSALPIITSLNGSMTHSFYNPLDNSEHFWSPYLEYFNVRATLNLAGSEFLFDDVPETKDYDLPRGSDSATQVAYPTASRGNSGWALYANYDYTESGRGSAWSHQSFINFTLRFNLTRNTAVTYTQSYDIDRKLTTSSRVNIIRTIHCWTGQIYWVPKGSNRGFGFKLNATQLPELKIDSNYDSFTSQSLYR